MQLGDQNTRAHEAGQNDMFGLTTDAKQNLPPARAAALPEWSEAVRLTGERETLGLYLTGHPLARFEASLKRFVSHRIGDLVSDRPTAGFEPPRFGGGKPVTVAGLIDEVKKRGPRVILTLDDRTGRIEAMLFEDTFQKYRDLIAKDALVLVDGSLRFDEFSDAWRLSVKKLTELDKVREQEARRLVIRCSHAEVPVLERAPGGDPGALAPGPMPDHHRVLGRGGQRGAHPRRAVERARLARTARADRGPGGARWRPGGLRGAPGTRRGLIRRRALS